MSTSIVSYLTDFSVTLFTKKPMNYLQVVLSCQVREIRRFAVFESRRSKVNWVVTTSACLCLDWGSQAVFPWAGTVKVWITGLFRSQTGRRWYRGKSAVTGEMCRYFFIISFVLKIDQLFGSFQLWTVLRIITGKLCVSFFSRKVCWEVVSLICWFADWNSQVVFPREGAVKVPIVR